MANPRDHGRPASPPSQDHERSGREQPLVPPHPPALTLPVADAQTLRAAIKAVELARDRFHRTVTVLTEAENEWRRRGDQLKAELCRGQVMAYISASEHVTEALVTAYGLWPQYEALLDPGAETPTNRRTEAP